MCGLGSLFMIVSLLKTSVSFRKLPQSGNRVHSNHTAIRRRPLLIMNLSTLAEMEEPVRLVSPAKNERIGKVIMLHGWAQNGWVFQSKTKGLTK